MSDRAARRPGPHREGEEPKPMMHGPEKSDSAIVATKPANKAGQPAAESVERRAGAKGNTGQQQHAPGTEPGKRVTGAGAHTASRKAKEKEKFTALLHHISADTLGAAFSVSSVSGPGSRRGDMAGV